MSYAITVKDIIDSIINMLEGQEFQISHRGQKIKVSISLEADIFRVSIKGDPIVIKKAINSLHDNQLKEMILFALNIFSNNIPIPIAILREKLTNLLADSTAGKHFQFTSYGIRYSNKDNILDIIAA